MSGASNFKRTLKFRSFLQYNKPRDRSMDYAQIDEEIKEQLRTFFEYVIYSLADLCTKSLLKIISIVISQQVRIPAMKHRI